MSIFYWIGFYFYKSSFHIEIVIPCQLMNYKYFFSCLCPLLHLFNCIFGHIKELNICKYIFPYALCYSHTWHKDTLHFSTSFIVFDFFFFTFRYLVHYWTDLVHWEFIFIYGMNQGSNFIFFNVTGQLFKEYSLEQSLLFHLICNVSSDVN